jgi:hypothetical protein
MAWEISAIMIDDQGIKQVITSMSDAVIGVRLSDGKLLWRYQQKAVSP